MPMSESSASSSASSASSAGPELPRRTVILTAAAMPLVACGKSGDGPAPAATSAAAGQVLATTAEVPVGSGVIAHGTLISQPTAGVFEGFVARCTHAGCALGLRDGKAICPCHGSRFNLDGSVAQGPATEPLASRQVTVRGGEIVADPSPSQ